MKKWVVYSILGFIFVVANIKITESIYEGGNLRNIVDSRTDSEGYYQYLPWTFVKENPLGQPYAVWLDNGYTLNKYTMGVAILESPFFFLAHEYSKWKKIEATGYTSTYGHFIAAGTNIYLFISFCVLFSLLVKQFSKQIALLSIVAVYLGTNLFYYGTIESGMSHVYSFFCFTMYLFFTDKYYENNKTKYIVALGAFLGLATLIRPTNILLIFIFIFYKSYSINDFKARLLFHVKRYYNFAIIFIIALIVFSPQMWYWYELTGKYLYYSYQNETFKYWNAPKIFKVLAGHKSGWLLYSPIMIFSLVGLGLGVKQKKVNAPIMIIIFLVILYICSSWWAYTFGCAFGYRSFTEYSALLIFPLALCLEQVSKIKVIIPKIIIATVFLMFILYSLRMTFLYIVTHGCWDGPNWHWIQYLNILKQVFPF